MDTNRKLKRNNKRKRSENNEISSKYSSKNVIKYATVQRISRGVLNNNARIVNDDPIIISDSDNDDNSNDQIDQIDECHQSITNEIIKKIKFVNLEDSARQKQIFPEYCEELFESMRSLLYNRRLDDRIHNGRSAWNITVKDILTVFSPKSWINDVVINDFLDLVKIKSNNTVWTFDTSFINLFLAYGYCRVRDRTKDVNIFTKKKLLIPVNSFNTHWTLICVDIERQSIHWYDSFNNPNSIDYNILIQLAMYLIEEYFVKNLCVLNLNGWKYFIGNSPMQINYYDCGAFVCMNSRELSRHINPSFTQDDMCLFRHLIVHALLEDLL